MLKTLNCPLERKNLPMDEQTRAISLVNGLSEHAPKLRISIDTYCFSGSVVVYCTKGLCNVSRP